MTAEGHRCTHDRWNGEYFDFPQLLPGDNRIFKGGSSLTSGFELLVNGQKMSLMWEVWVQVGKCQKMSVVRKYRLKWENIG